MSGELYWRYKKDGKWTWKPVYGTTLEELEDVVRPLLEARNLRFKWVEE